MMIQDGYICSQDECFTEEKAIELGLIEKS